MTAVVEWANVSTGQDVDFVWAGTRLSPGFVMVFGPSDDEDSRSLARWFATSHATRLGARSLTRRFPADRNRPTRKRRQMITHVWSMSFTEETTDEQRTAFAAAMAALPSLIDGVESFTSGVDLGLNPGNADVVIIAEFANADAWRAYIGAPAHVSFVEDHVNPLCASWGAIQFDAAATA